MKKHLQISNLHIASIFAVSDSVKDSYLKNIIGSNLPIQANPINIAVAAIA